MSRVNVQYNSKESDFEDSYFERSDFEDLIFEEDPEEIERVLKEIEAKEKRLAEVTK